MTRILHDTPSRESFARAARTFSSGCIRLEHPIQLAVELLRRTSWTPDAIQRALEDRQDLAITLPEAIPVHLQY